MFDAWGSSTSSTKKASDSQQHRYAELEFTEDPFKDVGFGDPFSAGGEDPFTATPNGLRNKNVIKDSDPFDPFSMDKDPFSTTTAKAGNSSNNNINNNKLEFDSPFGSSNSAWPSNGRAADPFAAAVASDNNNKSTSSWGDDFKFSPPASNKSPLSSTLKSRLSSASSSSAKGSQRSSLTGESSSMPRLNEEEAQLAWAAAESVRLEQERRRKAELQEKADLEMAIALSKSEMSGVGCSSSPSRSDRLI